MSAARREFEIVVAGGGPVGSACAAWLARHSGLEPARIALLAPPAPAIARTSRAPRRVSALSRASQQLLERCGAWEAVPVSARAAYEHMRVWHQSVPPDGPEVLCFSAAEMALPDLGHIVDNQAVQEASLQAFRAAGGVVLESALADLRTTETGQSVRLEVAPAEAWIDCRLLIAADGARSPTRERLGLGFEGHAYDQQAIVADIASARPHRDTCWQRFLDTGPLALLPLADGGCSIVWSAADAEARRLMALDDDAFGEGLTAASDRVLGRLRPTSARLAVPLRHASVATPVASRTALVGDAAHVIHPLAGQGVNLGFLDVAALGEVLATAIAEGEDPGCVRVLNAFARRRQSHNALMGTAMSAFNALYSRGGLGGWFAARTLGIAAAAGPVRQWFARQALGG